MTSTQSNVEKLVGFNNPTTSSIYPSSGLFLPAFTAHDRTSCNTIPVCRHLGQAPKHSKSYIPSVASRGGPAALQAGALFWCVRFCVPSHTVGEAADPPRAQGTSFGGRGSKTLAESNRHSPKAINRIARCWRSLHRVYRSTTISSLKAMHGFIHNITLFMAFSQGITLRQMHWARRAPGWRTLLVREILRAFSHGRRGRRPSPGARHVLRREGQQDTCGKQPAFAKGD